MLQQQLEAAQRQIAQLNNVADGLETRKRPATIAMERRTETASPPVGRPASAVSARQTGNATMNLTLPWQTVLRQSKSHFALAAILLFCAANLHFGLRQANPALTAAGAIGLCYVMLQAAHISDAGRKAARKPLRRRALVRSAAECAGDALAQERCAVLLRRGRVEALDEATFQRAADALRQAMALAPEGPVILEEAAFSAEPGETDAKSERSSPAGALGRVCMVQVERFFLDRCPVTNRQYFAFVAAGGYRQQLLWDKAAWPEVASLVDLSGAPGPQYWNNGRFAPGEEKLPVVGVSWHEAAAFARWAGKRLPTDAEWVKAAAWPVAVSASECRQRRYPWGNVMESRRANLWGCGPNRIVPIDEFPEGISVGGVSQLIGNVWEWIDGDIRGKTASLRSIRGGAFDTFFDDSALGQFQSGEDPWHRRHNIGFRCAVGAADIVLSRSAT